MRCCATSLLPLVAGLICLTCSAGQEPVVASPTVDVAYASCDLPLTPQPATVPCLRIQGKILDLTQNHGRDRRIYSPVLGCKRDLYIYLPPGYCPQKQYPVMIVLHGILQDERAFLDWVAKPLDDAIMAGCLPPLIVAAPDGSFTGDPSPWDAGSFYVNGPRGPFRSWIEDDLWHFLNANFPSRSEAKARILAGASMGGIGAFGIGLMRPERFGTLVGVMPALNLRWMDRSENYMANFDPGNWGWRNKVDNPMEVIGQYGPLKIHMKDILLPAFGRGSSGILLASASNPIEMIDRFHIKPGQVDMFICMAGKDNFNLDAQAQSFEFLARHRGLEVGTYFDPEGRHNIATAQRMIPIVFRWLNERLQALGPAL